MKFRKVGIEMSRGGLNEGKYRIDAWYKGKHITTYTNNSEAWDWFYDTENREKHRDALRYCYSCIVQAYNNI